MPLSSCEQRDASSSALRKKLAVCTPAAQWGVGECRSFTPGAFRLRGLINVMASDISGFKTPFSNYGPMGVDVAAPGTLIFAGTNLRAASHNNKCSSCGALPNKLQPPGASAECMHAEKHSL